MLCTKTAKENKFCKMLTKILIYIEIIVSIKVTKFKNFRTVRNSFLPIAILQRIS